MKAHTKKIGPAEAREILAKNPLNRPLNKAHVERLAREMTSGNWIPNGDTICFSGSRLIDGQHRLSAIIASGLTMEMLVVEGLDESAFLTKDVGRRRSSADALAIHGEKNCTMLGAGLGALLIINKSLAACSRFTGTEITNALDENPEMRNHANWLAGSSLRNLLPSGFAIAIRYLCHKSHPREAVEFFDSLESGVNLSAKSPILILRQRLIANKSNAAKLRPEHVAVFLIKAWNAYISGVPLRILRWVEAEPFPTIL